MTNHFDILTFRLTSAIILERIPFCHFERSRETTKSTFPKISIINHIKPLPLLREEFFRDRFKIFSNDLFN